MSKYVTNRIPFGITQIATAKGEKATVLNFSLFAGRGPRFFFCYPNTPRDYCSMFYPAEIRDPPSSPLPFANNTTWSKIVISLPRIGAKHRKTRTAPLQVASFLCKTRSSSREVRIRVPDFFLQSILVDENPPNQKSWVRGRDPFPPSYQEIHEEDALPISAVQA